jgi:type IV pilus assembly protein PilE
MHKNRLGFTLLELMVALAIMGILVSLSYPLYTHHLVKARREQAEMALLQLAGRLEVLHSLDGSYKNATTELHMEQLIKDDSYHLQIENVTDEEYQISAVPQKSQAESDIGCGKLSLNEKGEHFVSGKDNIDNCWSY